MTAVTSGAQGPDETLLRQIETFCLLNGVTLSRFGRDAVGDPKFVYGLRNGRRVLQSTAEKVRKFMREYRA